MTGIWYSGTRLWRPQAPHYGNTQRRCMTQVYDTQEPDCGALRLHTMGTQVYDRCMALRNQTVVSSDYTLRTTQTKRDERKNIILCDLSSLTEFYYFRHRTLSDRRQ